MTNLFDPPSFYVIAGLDPAIQAAAVGVRLPGCADQVRT
jgi:hypothetical protein